MLSRFLLRLRNGKWAKHLSWSKSVSGAGLAFVLGIVLHGLNIPLVFGTVTILIIFLLGAVTFTGVRKPTLELLIFGLLISFATILGFQRALSAQPNQNSIIHQVGNSIVLEGRVRAITNYGRQSRVLLDQLATNTPITGRLYLYLPIYPTPNLGDTLEFKCTPTLPGKGMNSGYENYLATRKIYATCEASAGVTNLGPNISSPSWWLIVIEKFHQHLGARVEAIYPEPVAGLVRGLLFGDDTFSDKSSELFKLTGTSHIVAASGYNVAVVVTLLFGILLQCGLSRPKAFPLLLIGLVFYALIAGAEPPVIRATIMAMLALTAIGLGRSTSVIPALIFALVGMLIYEPRYLLFDVGFQLSFLSTIGLIFFSAPIAKRLPHLPNTLGLKESVASTVAATIATMPVVLFSFGFWSPIALITNALILVFIPYLMALAALALLVGVVSEPLARLVITPSYGLATYIFAVIKLGAKFSVISLSTLIGWGSSLVATLTVIRSGFVFVLRRRNYWSATIAGLYHQLVAILKRSDRALGIAVIGLFSVLGLIISVQHSAPVSPGVTRISVLDIGQGDSILLQTREKSVLIDGGPDPLVLEELGKFLPWWQRKIDLVILTHPHADHLLGLLSVGEKYEIAEVWDSGQISGEPFFEAYEALFPNHQSVGEGDNFKLSQASSLAVLYPPTAYNNQLLTDPNVGSLILELTTASHSALFMGDAGREEEEKIIDQLSGLPVKLVKVGHHGSKTASSTTIVNATTPDFAVISAGKENKFGHPDSFVVSRWEAVGATVWLTATQGSFSMKLNP